MKPGILLLFLVAAGACRSRPPYRAPDEPFLRGDAGGTLRLLQAEGAKGIAPEDEALWRSEAGTAALCAGDEEAAFRALHAASAIMGTLESTSTENARAILGAEATKTWRGDPHERCMNALYKGILYWRRGDLDNAAACFKRGLLADGWSEAGEHQQDFAVLSFLLAWVCDRRGLAEQARFSFEEAARHQPKNRAFKNPRPRERNVLAVVEIGRGPTKVAEGLNGSVARFYAHDIEEGGMEFLLDGRLVGRTGPGTDLYIQAVTRGDRVLDGVRKGKAIFKEGAKVGGIVLANEGARRRDWKMAAAGVGAILLSALTNAEADTRHWVLLPGEVQAVPLSLPPGPHTLTARVLDRNGHAIPGWQRDFSVDVTDSNDTLYYFRSGGRRSIHALTGRHQSNATP
ncbi:MAG: hypothetical protein ACT4PV_07855 [Planctomycetaceae bacterium]